MLTLAHPLLLALLPIPLLVWWLLPPHRETRQGLVVPFLGRLAEHSGQDPSRGAVIARGAWWRWLSLGLCWVALVVALARPQVIEAPITKEVPVRDLLLAVDLSGSMATEDFKNSDGKAEDRLSAVKGVLDDFLTRRQGDRVGLIFFGSAPFVQAPFTEDLEVCRQLLDEAQVKMAGPQTAFGDALGLAINQFDRSTVNERVLIALTDGNDTASQVPPIKAAQIAHDKGIVIHTVAVGDPRAAGEDALDETTLKKVAEDTGGLYAHAADRAQLAGIYDQLDKLESHQAQTISHRPRRDVYWWALLAAFAISLLQLTFVVLRQRHAQHQSPAHAPLVLAALLPFVLVVLVAATAAPAQPTEPATAAFHFIRPLWLLALIPAALLWWLLRQQSDASKPWRGIVAPHLLPHLLSGERSKSRFDPLSWIAAAWLIAVVAIAGPTWKHEAAPFADDTAALAIVMKVSPSMLTEDVQPSRLARATQKVHDLLAKRGNAKTSLIAYSGTAHVVMPATTDAGIIDTFAESLDPKIMPVDGDVAVEALTLADRTLADAGGGSILWIADSVSPDQIGALASWHRRSGSELRFYPPLLPGDERDAAEKTAGSAGGDIVALSADDSDIETLAKAAKFAKVSGGDNDTRWAESGYWLTPLIALLILPFFRKGWMLSSASIR